jgi:hypothetical protein
MDPNALIWIGIFLAFYGIPFAVGFCAGELKVSVLLAFASFCGLYATFWWMLGPLLVLLVGTVMTRNELLELLILGLVVGATQAVVVAALGLALRRLVAHPKDHSPYEKVSTTLPSPLRRLQAALA